MLGIAADKMKHEVERFIEKKECRCDCPLAFDERWRVKEAFRKVLRVGALAVPHAFLVDGKGNIVWRQAYSAGYAFATMGFYSQLSKLLAGEPLDVSRRGGARVCVLGGGGGGHTAQWCSPCWWWVGGWHASKGQGE